MKTAVILTGHMRCWESVFPAFKGQIIDKYNPDIFISTWGDEGWWRPHSQLGYNESSPQLDIEKVNELYNPVSFVAENYSKIEPYLENRSKQFENYIHNPKNVVSMLYKLHHGGVLLEQFIGVTGRHYDLVIRMRPDMIFNQELPVFSPSKFYTIDHKNHLNQGTGDMFQVGSVNNILSYTKMFVNLNAVYITGKNLCPHIISKTWIEMLGLNWEELSISKTIVHSPFGSYVPSSGNTALNLKQEEDNKKW